MNIFALPGTPEFAENVARNNQRNMWRATNPTSIDGGIGAVPGSPEFRAMTMRSTVRQRRLDIVAAGRTRQRILANVEASRAAREASRIDLPGLGPVSPQVREIIGQNLQQRRLKPPPSMSSGTTGISQSTKNLSEGTNRIVNKMFTARNANYMGLGLMGAGGLSAYRNTRDGNYGRAALGAGAAYAGFQLYRNPSLAANMANKLVTQQSAKAGQLGMLKNVAAKVSAAANAIR